MATIEGLQLAVSVLVVLDVLVAAYLVRYPACKHQERPCRSCAREAELREEAAVRRDHDSWHKGFDQPGCPHCRRDR